MFVVRWGELWNIFARWALDFLVRWSYYLLKSMELSDEKINDSRMCKDYRSFVCIFVSRLGLDPNERLPSTFPFSNTFENDKLGKLFYGVCWFRNHLTQDKCSQCFLQKKKNWKYLRSNRFFGIRSMCLELQFSRPRWRCVSAATVASDRYVWSY